MLLPSLQDAVLDVLTQRINIWDILSLEAPLAPQCAAPTSDLVLQVGRETGNLAARARLTLQLCHGLHAATCTPTPKLLKQTVASESCCSGKLSCLQSQHCPGR